MHQIFFKRCCIWMPHWVASHTYCKIISKFLMYEGNDIGCIRKITAKFEIAAFFWSACNQIKNCINIFSIHNRLQRISIWGHGNFRCWCENFVHNLMPVPKVTLSETTFRIEVYKEKYSWNFLFTVFIQLKSTFMLTTVCWICLVLEDCLISCVQKNVCICKIHTNLLGEQICSLCPHL